MIVTPEQLVQKFFPEPIETTRELYDRLDLQEAQYSYLNWLKDAEEHCLANFVNEVDYKLLPDSEKNYWISPRVFWTLIQTSPSPVCDQIRAGLRELSAKIATDRTYARKLQDQLDQENGIETVIPRVSKKLKSQYNQTGHDAFEFSVEADSRLYLNIISGYNFQPGQKIEQALIFFKLETEQGVPYHLVDISLSLANGPVLSYRTIWCCSEERQRYGAILKNRVIRVNLFEDNNRLVDSYEYIPGKSDIKSLETELEKAIGILIDQNADQVDIARLGEKILNRYNLNEQAYAQAITTVIPSLPKSDPQAGPEAAETAFLEAINQYWKYYVLQPDPTNCLTDDLAQMTKDRIPRVRLAMLVVNILDSDTLCDRYFQRSYSRRQKKLLLKDISPRLIYALAEAADFDPAAADGQRVSDMCNFITDHLELLQELYIEAGQWPSN
jgi:hypothetical protein